jgi:hypothetical protein
MKYSASHFKYFGSVAYSRFLEELRRKLGNRSEKCTFIVYSEYHNAYRLYNPVNKNTIVREVKFQEDKYCEDQTNEKIGSQIPFLKTNE